MSKTIKFAGPSKTMRDALEAEGLSVDWDKNLEDIHDLIFEGTYYTGDDWEKCVIIDLRDEGDLSTKFNVDAAISNQLDEAYEDFSIDEEMKMYLQGTARARAERGVPSAERLLADMQEQDSCLKRFAEVAEAVSSGRPVPPKKDEMVKLLLTKEEAVALTHLLNGVSKDEFLIKQIGKKLEGQVGE